MQRKYILGHLAKADDLFWQRAEDFAEMFVEFLHEAGMTLDSSTDAYLKMCGNMLKEQVKFKRTGRYSCQSADQANNFIYSSEKEMTSYMLGVALSQFLWPNHYGLYDFFVQESKKLSEVTSYLEVGPGHGLYVAESIRNFPEASFYAVDISPISKRISEAIVCSFSKSKKCTFEVKDVNLIDQGNYDYIVMCEVLEHLDDPKSVMIRIRDLLSEHGHLFITTCANCPAIDHVYLFESVEQIRQVIRGAGFEIISDLPLPVYDIPEWQWVDEKVEVNYAAMLKRA